MQVNDELDMYTASLMHRTNIKTPNRQSKGKLPYKWRNPEFLISKMSHAFRGTSPSDVVIRRGELPSMHDFCWVL